MQLEGKIAVVTGGGRGIGKSIALVFAGEGADVVIAARTEADLKKTAAEIEAMGRKCLAIVTDQAVPEQVHAMVDRTLETFGRVDILVNNAGIGGPSMSVADMDLEAWNQTLAINLTGSMLCAKYILKDDMIPRKSGNIINISSVSGRFGHANRSPYSASKWGIIGLTQSLALEVGKYGIRVNCITPGPVVGERIEWAMRKVSQSQGISYEQAVANEVARTALGRMVKPEEVGYLAVFLASDRSVSITGQTINCCAGLRMD
jgi:NAD(P)-dependent dehydrogenase (short-subunit alcohol dehydrogenase family)